MEYGGYNCYIPVMDGISSTHSGDNGISMEASSRTMGAQWVNKFGVAKVVWQNNRIKKHPKLW